MFPVKQSLCNLDHHQTKSRKQLQAERHKGQIKGNVTYNIRTIQCHCFLTLAGKFIQNMHSVAYLTEDKIHQVMLSDQRSCYQVTHNSWYSTVDCCFDTPLLWRKMLGNAKNNF